jgi:hypothetical protein
MVGIPFEKRNTHIKITDIMETQAQSINTMRIAVSFIFEIIVFINTPVMRQSPRD